MTNKGNNMFVDKPSHYTVGVDVFEFAKEFLTEEEYIGALKFNALKYFYRQGRKATSPNDDGKCRDYLFKLHMKRLEQETEAK